MIRSALVWVLLPACQVLFPLDQTTPTDAPAFGCPGNYVTVIGRQYSFHSEHLTWGEANNTCKSEQVDSTKFTHLVVFDNEEERGNLVGSGRFDEVSYIGLTDLAVEGQFRWITDQGVDPAYPPASGPPWADDQPDDNSGDEDCVTINASGALDDVSCTGTSQTFICECDDVPSRL